MSDTQNRDAVLERFYAQHYGKLEPLPVVEDFVMDAMADRIVELEAAVERVRALHAGRVVSSGLRRVCWECEAPFPCPTLRALEGTP